MSGSQIMEYVDLLGNVEIFGALDRVTLAKIAAHLEPVPVNEGAVLFWQGAPPDGFYLISRGTFGIYCAGPGNFGEMRLGTLSRGDTVGEMALLTGQTRSATVRAEEPCEALRLDRSYFLSLLRHDPSVAVSLAATLSRRLQASNAARLTGAPGGPPAGPSTLADSPQASATQTAPAAPPKRRWRPGRVPIGLALAGLTLALGWSIPPPPGLSPAGWHALATVIALVPLLALGALADGALALALAGLWVLGGVAPTSVALSGFATDGWVLIVSIFAVGAAIASSGLLYRLALLAVMRAGRSFARQVAALSCVGLLIGPAVPNATGRVSLIAPVIAEIADALGYARGSRPAAGLAMAVLVGFGQMAAPFLTSSTTALLAFSLLPDTSQAGLSWVTWAQRALPANAVLLAALLAVILWHYRPPRETAQTSRQLADALAIQRALLGPPARPERISFLVAVLLLLGFLTQPIHKVPPVWIGVASFTILAATGVLTADTLRNINWNFVLLFGILSSMTEVFASSGLDRWLAGMLAEALRGLTSTPVLFVAALTLFCLPLNFLLRWQAVVPLLIITLGPVASEAGIDPWIVAIVALMACNGFLMPYQSTIYLALYNGSGGHLFGHAQARPMAIAYAVLTLVVLCASVPLWQTMGLL